MSYKPSPEDCAFVLAGLCSLTLSVVLGLPAAEWLVRHATYWVLLASIGAFFYSGYRVAAERKAALGNWAQSLYDGRYMVLILLIVAAIYSLQPNSYKVVMDEPLLVASSRQMHLDKELYVPKSCYELGGAFYNFDGYVDKRPGFFPFLLSLLHDLTGYRSGQGFVLNALLVPALVLLTATLCGRLWPDCGKWMGPLLLVTVPLVSLVANSSGYDFLNVVLLLSLLLLALQFYEYPGTWTLSALLWASVLLAHTRYESALYLFPVLLMVALRSFFLKRTFFHWTSCLMPLALLPVVLLMRVIGGQEDPLQLREGDAAAFSGGYIGANLRSAADFFFHFNGDQPNSWLLSVLFSAAVCSGFFLLQRGLKRTVGSKAVSLWPVYGLMGAGLMAYVCMVLLYHWGQLNDAAASRLALPIIVAQILVVVGVCGRFSRGKGLAWALGISSVAYFTIITLPTVIKTDFLTTYPAAHWAKWQKEKAIEYKDENVLFVSQHRLVAVVEEVSAISIGKALGAKEKIAFHHKLGTFSKILFVRLLIPGESGDLVEPIPLESDFELKELERQAIGMGREVVLSELKVVHLSPAEKLRLNAMDFRNYDLSMEWFHVIPDTLP